MQCKYVAPETNLRCRSPYASVKTGGYCWAHGVKMGFVSKGREEERKKRLRIRKSMDEIKPKDTEKMAELLRNGDQESGDNQEAVSTLMNVILQDRGFKAHGYYAKLIENRKTDPAYRKYAGKRTVVAWWMSDEVTRIPRGMDDLAKTIGFTRGEVNVFLDSDEFAKLFDEMRLNFMRRSAYFIDKINLRHALEGRKESISEFNKVLQSLKEKENAGSQYKDPTLEEMNELERNEKEEGFVTQDTMKLKPEESVMEELVIDKHGPN